MFYFVSLAPPLCITLILYCQQVQEKKVKKISDMNADTFKGSGNGSIASSSVSSGPKQGVPNGSYPDRSNNSLGKDLSFPPGGISSLRLPVVFVLNQTKLEFHIFIKVN